MNRPRLLILMAALVLIALIGTSCVPAPAAPVQQAAAPAAQEPAVGQSAEPY